MGEQGKVMVGTVVGESTTQEFRMAVTPGQVRVQDLVAVDAHLTEPDGGTKPIRIWAKVEAIERLNPLFPRESAQELADLQVNPFDTVISMSREMITAVCRVLGYEEQEGADKGKLKKLRYPPQPASSVYRPERTEIEQVMRGEWKANRLLDIATLSTYPDVNVKVDGHAIVTRHLAILAMTGAGKSWTARRIVEQLAGKNYPIVIFDPHGDYTGLADLDSLKGRVKRYYARFPVFEEDAETVAQIVSTLGYELSPTMQGRFPDVFQAAKSFWIEDDPEEMKKRVRWLADFLDKQDLIKYGVQPNMWLIANIAEAGELALRNTDQTAIQTLQEWGWKGLSNYSGRDKGTLEAIKKRTYKAAAALHRMEQISRKIAGDASPLPTDRKELVNYGEISVISLAGYTGDFKATIYRIIAEEILKARVSGDLAWPVLLLLEEAHNFAPAHPGKPAEQRVAERAAAEVTRQIAQEGRKFGVGLILISQRPSRLDETTLSQCNSSIIMRLVNPNDQAYVRRVIETLGEDEVRLLPDLDVGEAILSGQFVNFPVLVKIKEPESKGEREERDAFEALEDIKKAGG